MKLLISAFKDSLKIAPLVLKDLTIYFGLGFFVFCFFIIFLFLKLQHSLGQIEFGGFFISLLLLVFSQLFIAFMVPYYTYRHSKGFTPDFWVFISDTVWPLCLAHIKVSVLILLGLFLFVVPGVYVAIRFSLLTESLFFDKSLSGSVLQNAQKATQSYFWVLFLCVLCFFLIKIGVGLCLAFLPQALNMTLSVVLGFYIACFFLLFKAQVYFHIKQAKNEVISL